MKFTYYGHACFAVAIEGKTILFDPYIKSNPLAKDIDIKQIKADYILISHGHFDHIEDAVELAQQTGAKVVTNVEIAAWLKKKGVNNLHAMNIGGHFIFEFGKVKCVTAVHSSALPDGTYGGSAMGFLIESKEINIYYSGDTALTYDMKLIGDYKRIDVCMLPVGNNFTMGVDNAIIAAEFVQCDKVIGLHFDTFEVIKINHEEATDKFSNAGKELLLPEIGKTIEV